VGRIGGGAARGRPCRFTAGTFFIQYPLSGKEFDNCLCDQFINIVMAGDLGRHISPAVFINIVVCAVTHKNGAPLGYFPN
jgi:hypothetical protein